MGLAASLLTSTAFAQGSIVTPSGPAGAGQRAIGTPGTNPGENGNLGNGNLGTGGVAITPMGPMNGQGAYSVPGGPMNGQGAYNYNGITATNPSFNGGLGNQGVHPTTMSGVDTLPSGLGSGGSYRGSGRFDSSGAYGSSRLGGSRNLYYNSRTGRYEQGARFTGGGRGFHGGDVMQSDVRQTDVRQVDVRQMDTKSDVRQSDVRQSDVRQSNLGRK